MLAARQLELPPRSPKPRSRQPLVNSPSPTWTRGPDCVPPTYYVSQHATWRNMIQMHKAQAPQHVCKEYLHAVERLGIDEHYIPELRQLDRRLKALSGWGIIKAQGYVQPRAFFQLLTQKLFPCSDLLRHASEVTYTSEPDMWHDVMGHLPMLIDPTFGEFNNLFGRIGGNVRNDTQFNVLQKVYWFSMEFGIINPHATAESAGPISSARLYGAAHVAAAQEMAMSLSPTVEHRPFSIEGVVGMETDVARVNTVLFAIPSFESLLNQLVDWARTEHLL
jgi:phenylalanine-4-hydroxylase